MYEVLFTVDGQDVDGPAAFTEGAEFASLDEALAFVSTLELPEYASVWFRDAEGNATEVPH